jgi:hypothetical protein
MWAISAKSRPGSGGGRDIGHVVGHRACAVGRLRDAAPDLAGRRLPFLDRDRDAGGERVDVGDRAADLLHRLNGLPHRDLHAQTWVVISAVACAVWPASGPSAGDFRDGRGHPFAAWQIRDREWVHARRTEASDPHETPRGYERIRRLVPNSARNVEGEAVIGLGDP